MQHKVAEFKEDINEIVTLGNDDLNLSNEKLNASSSASSAKLQHHGHSISMTHNGIVEYLNMCKMVGWT